MLGFPDTYYQRHGAQSDYLGLEYDMIGIEEATTLSSRKHQDITTCCRTSKADWRPRIHSTTNPGGIGYGWGRTVEVRQVDLCGLNCVQTYLSCVVVRDVLTGEDAVKSAGARYLPQLDAQTDEEYSACAARAAFLNATARSAEGYLRLIFRRPPFIKLPEGSNQNPHPGPLLHSEWRRGPGQDIGIGGCSR